MSALPAVTTGPRPLPRVQRAVLGDLVPLEEFIAAYTADGTLLVRTRANLVQHIRDFLVVRGGGDIVGCGALQIVGTTLAEVRSVAVHPDWRGAGLGSRIVEGLLRDARRLGLPRVFCLTRRESFFARLGFEAVPRECFPHKIWSDCRLCPRETSCDEVAMQRYLTPLAAGRVRPLLRESRRS